MTLWSTPSCHHGTPITDRCDKCISEVYDRIRQLEKECEQKVLDAYRDGLKRGLEHAGGDTYQADVPMEKK
jgi:hypothetical protein